MQSTFSAQFDLQVASENAFIIYSKQDSLIAQNQAVIRLKESLLQFAPPWLLDLVPAYASLLLSYDLSLADRFAVKHYLTSLSLANETGANKGKLVELPVCYGFGQDDDLIDVARQTGLAVDDVISLHSNAIYQVFAIGFAPGFAYLGELAQRLTLPRRATPRQKVPGGAVAIAERQTAVYPAQSPGGWHIIGRCPLPLFRPQYSPPMPLDVGDKVKFAPISENRYYQLTQEYMHEA